MTPREKKDLSLSGSDSITLFIIQPPLVALGSAIAPMNIRVLSWFSLMRQVSGLFTLKQTIRACDEARDLSRVKCGRGRIC